MKYAFCASFFLLVSFGSEIFAQNNNKIYFDRLILGTSLTLIPNNYTFANSSEDYLYLEYTWNNNIAIDITRRWRMGFQYLATLTKSEISASQKYFMAGTFLQFNFLPKDIKRDRLYIEASYSLGNHCSCGDFEPYKLDNIRYWGLGAGADFKLTNWLRLDLGFFNSQIFNKIEGKYNWTQYIMGLEFLISIKK